MKCSLRGKLLVTGIGRRVVGRATCEAEHVARVVGLLETMALVVAWIPWGDDEALVVLSVQRSSVFIPDDDVCGGWLLSRDKKETQQP